MVDQGEEQIVYCSIREKKKFLNVNWKQFSVFTSICSDIFTDDYLCSTRNHGIHRVGAVSVTCSQFGLNLAVRRVVA